MDSHSVIIAVRGYGFLPSQGPRRGDGLRTHSLLAPQNNKSRSSTLQLIPGVRTARMLRRSRSRGALHEAFLRRSGMRRLRVVPRTHTSGRLGSPSAATTSGCHVMAGRGQAQGGESRRMRAYARGLARKRGPLAQNRREWSVERRFRGCCSPSHGEPAAAQLPRRAFRRSAPLIARGENPSTNSRRGARIIRRGCLKCESDR
jgi:hypothetical protein